MFEAIPQNKKIISQLSDFICSNSLDGPISYPSLNEIAGKNVQNGARYLLQKAIEDAEKRLSCVFSTVWGHGIKRLPPDETSQIGSDAITGIRRKARRAVKRMVRVNTNQMTQDARQNTALKAAHLNLIEGMADNRKTRSMVAPATADPYAAKKAMGI